MGEKDPGDTEDTGGQGDSGVVEAGGRNCLRKKMASQDTQKKKSRLKGKRLLIKMHLVDTPMARSQQQRPQVVHSLRGMRALVGGFSCLHFHLSEDEKTGFS